MKNINIDDHLIVIRNYLSNNQLENINFQIKFSQVNESCIM